MTIELNGVLGQIAKFVLEVEGKWPSQSPAQSNPPPAPPAPPSDSFDPSPAPAPAWNGQGLPPQGANASGAAPNYSAADSQRIVTALYQGLLGRNPDSVGMSGYASTISSGHLADAVNGIVTSDEFRAHASSLTPGQLTDALYQSILGRNPDASGMVATQQAISSGGTAARVFDMITSPEFARQLGQPQPAPPQTPSTTPAQGTTPAPSNSNGIPADAIDLSKVKYLEGANISSWTVDDKITNVSVDPGRGTITVDHTKAGQWPQLPFFGDSTNPIEGNIWYFANINGQWYGGAGDWLRPGQTTKAIDPGDVGGTEFYNAPDPLKSWTPKPGELVGIAVSTPARAGQQGTAERSNVVLVPWP